MSNDVLNWRHPLSRWGVRTALISLFATVSWVGSPKLNRQTVSFEILPAHAQTVTDEEVRNYAESVLQMDDSRLTAYTQISDILTSQGLDVTEYNLSCPNAQNLTEVPRQVRSRVQSVLIDYCNAARIIVEENGLTVRQFNNITSAHRDDEDLAQRIQAEIASLQQPE